MLKNIKLSLTDLLGAEYAKTVASGAVFAGCLKNKEANKILSIKQGFYPAEFAARADALVSKIGKSVIPPAENTAKGAGTESFKKAANMKAAPVGGLAFFRIGEDGRLYLVSKSEHYHAPLGHSFPGYKLLENASRLGIPNATHNNTRGHITRLAEEELVRTANGIKKTDRGALNQVLTSKEKHVLNRVINLETGSLAVEAGLKMMLARFYKLDKTFTTPVHSGKTPVFLVMGDFEKGRNANYHGTTIVAQTLRGLWPEIGEKLSKAGILRSEPVAINDYSDFKRQFKKFNSGKYRVAGFLHEIIMMNYGGIKLKREYLKKAYGLCHSNGVPVLVDEIQSCMWYPGMYLFKAYGLNPDFVAIGKGFPGGQYPASKILTTAEMDNLNQFGALVTNGQEELASLAYLITMAFVEANGEHLGRIGRLYEAELKRLAARHRGIITKIEGLGLLSSIFFKSEKEASKFASKLCAEGIDISAQTYKANCPPAALTKPPVIASKKMLKYLVSRMESVLKTMKAEQI